MAEIDPRVVEMLKTLPKDKLESLGLYDPDNMDIRELRSRLERIERNTCLYIYPSFAARDRGDCASGPCAFLNGRER